MEISKRLKKIIDLVPSCGGVIDIGTDHGYVPIALLRQGKVHQVIASDNKPRPLERAMHNAQKEGIENMECRLGSGFKTIQPKEVDGAILAGMGGILIRDLMEMSMDVVKSMKFLLLQPAQNSEVLREYLYRGPFVILSEELVKEDQRYYEYMLVRYDEQAQESPPTLEYRVGTSLVLNHHPLLLGFLESKKKEQEMIRLKIRATSRAARQRLEQVDETIVKLEEMLK